MGAAGRSYLYKPFPPFRPSETRGSRPVLPRSCPILILDQSHALLIRVGAVGEEPSSGTLGFEPTPFLLGGSTATQGDIGVAFS